MTHLDLFTGIGGFHLAAEWAGFETIGFSEIEPYPCKLLDQKWPTIKNYGDIKTADFGELRGTITVLSAGVPCQPASLAGKGLGEKDDRWLWPQTIDIVEQVRPTWCVFENPPGIFRIREFEAILLRLEEAGYELAEPFQVPANAVGANHLRYRVFFVAYSKEGGIRRAREGARRPSVRGEAPTVENSECFNGVWGRSRRREEDGIGSFYAVNGSSANSCNVSNPNRTGLEGRDGRSLQECSGQRVTGEGGASTVADTSSTRCGERQSGESQPIRDGARRPEPERHDWRLTEPPLCRAVDGISHRSHRLKALGNSVVPQQAYPFFKAIAQVEGMK